MIQLAVRSRIHKVGVVDLRWPYHGASPQMSIRGSDGAARSFEVDPFPCYRHDDMVVGLVVQRCEQLVPPATEMNIWVAGVEETSRTLGFAAQTFVYDWPDPDDDREAADRVSIGHIWLSGKRTPIHPAVTRYLVAHEWAHHVGYWLAAEAGDDDDNNLMAEYAELRGVDDERASGTRWHTAVREVFANDWRVLVAGVEPDFWPHDVINPHADPAVVSWWRDRAAGRTEAKTAEGA